MKSPSLELLKKMTAHSPLQLAPGDPALGTEAGLEITRDFLHTRHFHDSVLLLSKKITIFNTWPNTNESIAWQLQLFVKESKDEVFTDTIHSEIGKKRNDKGKGGEGGKGTGGQGPGCPAL